MATDTATLTPVEIDTILAANYEEQFKLTHKIISTINHIEHLKNRVVKAQANLLPSLKADIDRSIARREEFQAARLALAGEAAPYQVEYNSRPWNRYFLVKNANGHVHRGLDCSTCFADTQYAWLVNLADCDEDAMIEEWGERACTVCFPSAPTNPLYNRPARIDREAREAKAAEKAAKDAAKAEKAITDVDGSPLKDSHGYTLKTKVAARNELSQAFQDLAWYGSQEYADTVRRLVPALEAAGVDWKKSATNAVAKVVKETSKPNPWAHQLTSEQIAENAAKTTANLALAQALLQEVIG